MIKMVVRGLPDEPGIQNFRDPIDAEAAYLRLCQFRTEGPGAVKIASRIPGVPDAYFRLDEVWDGPREQHHERFGLWTDTAEGYEVPTPFQLRAAGRTLDLSGEEIARRLGITGRQWRYYLSEGERRDMPWSEWRCIRLWLAESR